MNVSSHGKVAQLARIGQNSAQFDQTDSSSIKLIVIGLLLFYIYSIKCQHAIIMVVNTKIKARDLKVFV